jgi:tetratricopeptide (TPR) repeat protein
MSRVPDDPRGSDREASERLDSWKEIAAFLKRDVRTVQRWEKLAGLPIHRHVASRLRTAYAYRSEIEEWWRAQRSLPNGVHADAGLQEPPREDEGHAPEPPAHVPTDPPSFTDAPAPAGLRARLFRPAWLALAAVVLSALAVTMVRWLSGVSGQAGPAPAGAVPVLLAPFEDHAGRPQLAVELHEGLGRGLERGGVLEPVGSARIAGTLRLMRRDPTAPLSPGLAQEVAIRDARIRYLVAGRVHALDSSLLADLRVVDPATSRTVASVEWKGETAEELLDEIDDESRRLTAMISEARPTSPPRTDLLEPVTSRVVSAVRLYTAAVHAGGRGEWGAAELLARRATAADPEFAVALAWTAWAMRHQGRPRKECLPLLERAAALAPHLSDRENYLVTGLFRAVSGDLPRATASFEALLRLHPQDRLGLSLLSNVLYRAGRVNRALDLAVSRAEQDASEFEANVRAAQLLTSAGRDAAAAAFVQRAQGLSSPDTARNRPSMTAWIAGLPVYLSWSAGDGAGAGRTLQALDQMMKAKLGLERDALSTTIGFAYLALGRWSEAERTFRAAASPSRQLNLAMLSLTADDEDAARRWLQQIPQHSAARPSLFARVGLAAEALRGLESDVPSPYREGIESVSLGLLDARRGRTAAAAVALRRGLDLLRWSGEPEYLFAIEELARMAEAQGDMERAVSLLRTAVDSRAHTYGARQWTAGYWAKLANALARLHRRQGRHADAERVLAGIGR